MEANYQKVSRQDIKNYIDKYIKGKPYIAGMVLNAEMNKKYQPASFFKLN
jgi:zinc protease